MVKLTELKPMNNIKNELLMRYLKNKKVKTQRLMMENYIKLNNKES